MPKPTTLTPDVLGTVPSPPSAATPPRTPGAAKPTKPPKPAAMTPLQIRIPRDQARAIKVAAAQAEQTISDFMLACFHAYMQSSKGR